MNRNEFLEALPLSRLVLKLTSATLEICTDAAIEYISIMASGADGDVNALKLSATGNQLLVEQPVLSRQKKPRASGWLQLTIRIPQSWRGHVDVRTISGCVTVRGLSGTDLTLETISGQIRASTLHFIDAVIRTVSGDVHLSDAFFEKAALHTASGAISALDCSMVECSLSALTGHATLDFCSPFREIGASSVTGNLTIGAPIEACSVQSHTVSGHVATNDLVQDGNAGSSVLFSTVSGNLTITNTTPEA